MKNTTPNQLAAMIAIILAIICLLGQLFLKFFFDFPISFAIILFWGCCNLFIGYTLFYFALERFIYRRIKLIYKRIHRLKKPADSYPDMIDMNRNMIEEVESEVVKWSEEKREEIEQLKKMELYRREFLGNVSHELKTPIFNILGYLHTLIDGGLADENINMSYLKKAALNADRLDGIVKELEIINRHEFGELPLYWANFKIYDLATQVLESSELTAKTKGVTLKFKDGCNVNAIVSADYEKIVQVLSNLVVNSIKYGKKGGTTWVGIYDMHNYILVEVSDNGVGIEAQHLPRVFERFYRTDKGRARMDGGSGLGLAIVKHIIEAHNQSIHVRSKEGVGSTFGFTLAKREV